MKVKKLTRKALLIVALTTVLLGISTLQAFALPPYVTANSNGSTSVYACPDSSSMVVGSIGVESVKVYWKEGGYYYIEYVVSSGAYGGYKRGYVPTSKINVSGISEINYSGFWSSNTNSGQTVYNRSTTNSYVIGTVWSSDPITVLEQDGGWYFIQYPITNGYKRGYVPKDTVRSYRGKARYRDGVKDTSLIWHGAIQDSHYYTGQLIEQSGYDVVRSVSYSTFLDGKVDKGARYVSGMNWLAFDNVTLTAEYLAKRQSITYYVFGLMIHNAPDTSPWVYPDNVTSMRCDGVIEYAYEWNNWRVQSGWLDGTEYWDISTPVGALAHNATITLNPQQQAGRMATY